MLPGRSFRIVQPHNGSWVKKWACLQDKYPHRQCGDFCSSTYCLQSDYYCCFTWHFRIEMHVDSSVPNDKTWYRSGTTSSFQTSPGSAYSIIIDVSVSGSTKENACSLLAFDIDIRTLYLVWWLRKRLGIRLEHFLLHVSDLEDGSCDLSSRPRRRHLSKR